MKNLNTLRNYLTPAIYRPEPIKIPPMLAHKADAEISALIDTHHENADELRELRVIRDEMKRVIEAVGFNVHTDTMCDVDMIVELDKCITFIKEAKAVL